MINSNDDIRYCQDVHVFGCIPVADIVKRRTTSFSNKYRAVLMTTTLCVKHVFDVDYQLIAAID